MADGDDAGRNVGSSLEWGRDKQRHRGKAAVCPPISTLGCSEREAASHLASLHPVTRYAHLLKDIYDFRIEAFFDLEVDVLDVELEGSYILQPFNVGIADMEVDLPVVREPSTIEPSISLLLLLMPPVPLLLDSLRSSERNESIADASRDTGSSTTSSVHSI